jgi:hypothetical protein
MLQQLLEETIVNRPSHVRFGLLLAAVLSLAGCNNDSNDAQIRMLNVSRGYDSIDFDEGSTALASAVVYGAASPYSSLAANTYTINFTVSGVTSALQSMSESLSAKSHNTFVVYGDTGDFATLEIGEDASGPSSGANVQLVDAAPDAGPVDVYFTDSTTALDDVSPNFSDVAGGTIASAGYVNVASGTYRMRITATGSKTDVRLDVASVTLNNGSVVSVVVADATGGVLVNAMILPQQGSLTADNNTSSRVRAAVGVSTGTAVNASIGGVSLLSGAPTSTISGYSLVTAGSAAVSLSVDGTAVTAANQTLAAGADYTLLVWTDSNGTEEALISEDNGLPSGEDAKIRVINSMSGLGDPISLAVNYSPEASSIALGGASAFSTVSASTTAQLGVTDATTSTTLYTNTAASLASQGVYTLFMFGSAATPVGTLNADR